ncbi:CYTH domain-containing protein [Acinetobacter boissieri]|uniref:CYTH domain-containing protein n=1 Tax=Acinetobacter boissieri TaxID=1219383 RepID=A0A1G6H5T3_9GAMM|nr:CYTH domain-containing protein [Acinetobacter boissieri]SDB89639.1 CYTH domain-containing protein [Acinetobacter boissieri]
MSEIELKLQIPKQKKLQILKAIQALEPKKIPLHAQYFDTSTFELAQKHTAIRLRKEGKEWIQTLKGASNDALQRYELEINRGETEQAPELQLKFYKKDKEAESLLGHFIKTPDQLVIQFETIVERQFKIITYNTSEIEVCLDLGRVGRNEHYEEICEIEFELKSGHVADLIMFTQQWVEQYGIWLDVRSKAERGNLISRSEKVSPAPEVNHFHLTKKMLKKPLLAKIITHYTRPLLPCVAAIADQVAEISHYQCAEVSLSHLIQMIDLFESNNTLKSHMTQLKHIKQLLSDYVLLSELQENIQPYTLDSFKGLAPSLSRLRAELAQSIMSKETTLLLLDLLNLSQNEIELSDITVAQFLQQLEQKYTAAELEVSNIQNLTQKDISLHDFEFYTHYLAIKKDTASKATKACITLQQTQHLQSLITSMKMLKTEQSFFLGWLTKQAIFQEQYCQKRIRKIQP